MTPSESKNPGGDVSRSVMISTLITSTIVGFAVGWFVSTSRDTPAAAATNAESGTEPQGDAGPDELAKQVSWARDTQSGGDGLLVKHAESFLAVAAESQAEELLPGTDRLIELVIADSERADSASFDPDRRRKLAQFLTQVIEGWSAAERLRPRIAELRRVR